LSYWKTQNRGSYFLKQARAFNTVVPPIKDISFTIGYPWGLLKNKKIVLKSRHFAASGT
jgi:hypothetical protein